MIESTACAELISQSTLQLPLFLYERRQSVSTFIRQARLLREVKQRTCSPAVGRDGIGTSISKHSRLPHPPHVVGGDGVGQDAQASLPSTRRTVAEPPITGRSSSTGQDPARSCYRQRSIRRRLERSIQTLAVSPSHSSF